MIELNALLNGDFNNNYNSGEFTTKILDRQLEFAKLFPGQIPNIEVNGIDSPEVCPDLTANNTNFPSDEAFKQYKSSLNSLKQSLVKIEDHSKSVQL